MSDSSKKQTILYSVIAALLFVVLFVATFETKADKATNEAYRVVAFGDSVLGLYRGEDSVTALLSKSLGQPVFNASFGGTCASMEKGLKQDYPRESLAMSSLAKSIYAKDFGVQQSVTWRESNMEYFSETIDMLETVDFSKVETVILQHGINDYHAGIPLENPEDQEDVYTYKGALRYTVKMLRKCNPDVKIVLVTPGFTWYDTRNTTCLEQDFGGGTLDVYIRAGKEVAAELGLVVADVFHETYPHDSWEDLNTYMEDGVHPNAVARKMIADCIAEAIQK